VAKRYLALYRESLEDWGAARATTTAG
jgi:hypothetical protein